MVDLKKKLWLIGVISAILGLLSIGIPWQIPYHPTIPGYYALFWLLGIQITVLPTGDTITQFLFSTLGGIIGIIATIVIVVFSLLLLLTSLKLRKVDSLSMKISVMWIIAGTLLIVTDIVHFILLYPYSVLYVRQVGSIFPFIAGGLSVASGIMAIILSKRG